MDPEYFPCLGLFPFLWATATRETPLVVSCREPGLLSPLNTSHVKEIAKYSDAELAR